MQLMVVETVHALFNMQQSCLGGERVSEKDKKRRSSFLSARQREQYIYFLLHTHTWDK